MVEQVDSLVSRLANDDNTEIEVRLYRGQGYMTKVKDRVLIKARAKVVALLMEVLEDNGLMGSFNGIQITAPEERPSRRREAVEVGAEPPRQAQPVETEETPGIEEKIVV